MGKKLLDVLDTLDVEEVSLLVKDEDSFKISNRTKNRIINSTKNKLESFNTANTYQNNKRQFLGGIFMKKKLAIGLTLTLLFTLTGGVFSYSRKAIAYVSLDINPSVELGVSPFNKVVSYEAYNEDGEKILEGNENLNIDVNKAVDNLVESAIKNDYIKEDGSSAISITAVTDNTDLADKLNDSLKTDVTKVLDENNTSADVETSNVALERRAMAKELGITPGKLNLIQKMQSLDPSIKVEDYKNASVKEIQKHTKELKKNAKDKTNDDANTSNSDENNVETPVEDTTVPNTSVDETKKTENNDTISNEEKRNIEHKSENNNSNKDVEKNKSENKTEEKDNAGNKDKVKQAPKDDDKTKPSNSGNGNSEKNNKNK